MQLVALSSSEQFSSDPISFASNPRSCSLGLSQTSSAFGEESSSIPEHGECSNWAESDKPVTLALMGTLGLLVGIILTVLYFTRVVEVPYVLGPICLSIGLMFMVTGLVWFQVVKEKIRQKGLMRILHTRQSAETPTP